VSQWTEHKSKWAGGCGSCQCAAAKKVLGRGYLPCDVLFVGEAPGESEEVLGKPMVGPAGQLLDRIIADAIKKFPTPKYAFTNIVGCIPRDGLNKASEPDESQIKQCQSRLLEFMAMAKPRLVVRVGKLSTKHCPDIGVPVVDLDHPAFILRSNEANRGLLMQRCVVQLRDAYEELNEKGG